MRLPLIIFYLCALFVIPFGKTRAKTLDIPSYMHDGGTKADLIDPDIWFRKYGHGIPYVAYEVMQDVIMYNAVTSHSTQIRQEGWHVWHQKCHGEAYKIGTAYLGVVVAEESEVRYLRSILITTIPLFDAKASPVSITDIQTIDVFGIKLKEIFNLQKLIDNENLESAFETKSKIQLSKIGSTEKIVCIEFIPENSPIKVRFYVLHDEYVGLQVFYDY